MKIVTAIFLLLFISNVAEAQVPVSKWEKHPLPTEEQVSAYNSASAWSVFLDSASGRVMAEERFFPTVDKLPFKPYWDTIVPWVGFRTVKKVSNGYLVGLNKGEFGGSLHWFSPSGDSTYRITRGSPKYIFELNGKIYVAGGLMHMGSDNGYVNEMVFTEGKWTVATGDDIANAPEVFLPVGNSLLIVTSASILFFKGLHAVEYVKRNGFWDVLYPQSVVIKDDEIYVGMRGGIYKINLKSHKEEWLTPSP